MKQFRKKITNEKGAIMVLFAFTLVILIGFVGIAVDFTMLYMRQNRLYDLCQIARDDRFTYQDELRYSNDPARVCYDRAKSTIVDKNGFGGTMTVYYQELSYKLDDKGELVRNSDWDDSKREYRMRIVVSENFKFTFLSLFGLKSTVLTQKIDGGQVIGEGDLDRVWHPDKMMSLCCGNYTYSNGVTQSFSASLPAGW